MMVYFLSKRQKEILDGLQNNSVRILADKLGIRPSTVYSIKDNVKAKIKESDRVKRKYRSVLYRKKKKSTKK